MIIGLAGKKMTEKSLVARFLTVHYDAVYAPFAATLKGGSMHRVGFLAFKPQWDNQARAFLQNVGTGRGRYFDPDLWIKAWTSCFGDAERAVIPDVRFPNEVEFIHERGGIVIYLQNPTVLPDPHPSEQLEPTLCDAKVLITDPYRNRQQLFAAVTDLLIKHGFEPKPRKPRLYVGGNIMGAAQPHETLNHLADLAELHGFDALIPADVNEPALYTDLLREKPLRDVAVTVVASDLSLIAEADGGLFALTEPSIGAACEIMALSLTEKPVAIVTPLKLAHHCWLWAFGTVFWQDVRKALEWLKSMLTLTHQS